MAKKKQKTEDVPKLRLPTAMSVDVLDEHPRNSQRQSRHVFDELKQSIQEHGFDESLIVVPRKDAPGRYYVVSGNHRLKAARAVGYTEVPVVVREDWDDVEAQIQLVRRNYVRGDIDKAAFTLAVNALAEDAAISLNEVMGSMGFADEDEFAKLYQEEREREERVASEARESATMTMSMIDDLGSTIASLTEQYGHTVPQGFIVFPFGGRNHMVVHTTASLKAVMEKCLRHSMETGIPLHVVLAGVATIGMHQAGFGTREADTSRVKELGGNEEPSDMDLIPAD